MINRVLVLLIAGCALFGSVIVAELMSGGTDAAASAPIALRPEPSPPPRAQRPRVDDLLATILARPLFSPTRQAAAGPDQPKGLDLGDVRLSGIVVAPEHRLAIFAVPDSKSVVRSEGEMMNDWRLDSITPGEVVLSGPAGTRTLQPKIDASLARRIAAPPRPAAGPPQVAGAAPQPAAAPLPPRIAPPPAAPPARRSMPAIKSPGTPIAPFRPAGAPRERQ